MKHLFFILIGVLYLKSDAQQMRYKFAVEKPLSYSWAHHNYMNHLTGRYVSGYQVNWIFDHQNKTAGWLKAYRYPETALMFVYQDLNHKNLGQTAALVFYYTFFLNNRNARTKFVFQFGEGLAYNTRPYDKSTNPKNVVFGSHILYAFYFSLKFRYVFIKIPLEAEAGFSLYHYSNGSYKVPNSGLNLPGINISLIYSFDNHSRIFDQKDFETDFESENYWGLYFRGTLNEADVPGIGIRPAYILGVERIWHPSFKHKYYAGLEYMVNYSLKAYLEYEEAGQGAYNGKIPGFKRAAVTFGHQFHLGDAAFVTGIGVYFYNPSGKERPWYVRAGLRYKIAKKWYLSATVKTHYFMAEEVDFGIHYNFKL